MVEKNVILGKNVVIFDESLVNIYGCEIGDDSFIGPFVEITSGVEIGKRCKIESHSFICDQVVLEDDVFIGHGVMFTNDLYPQVDRQIKRLSTKLKQYSSIGSNSTLLCGITIGVNGIIGAGSVVTKDVPDFSIAAGNPARILKTFSSKEELIAYMSSRQPLKKS